MQNALWRRAKAKPSLDLRFAENKSLVDATTGQNLVTFTRASSATYVDSTGTIRSAVTNLLLRSEEIGTSPWATNNTGATTYTANAIAAPTGAVTADRVTATADFAGPVQFVSVTSGFSYSFSFYVKAVTPGSLDSIRIECFGGRFALFNVTTRVFSSVNAAITPSSISLGDGWVRVQCLFAAPSTGSLAVAIYANTSADFYLWGAQLEQSSTVGEYVPTTSTINSAPRFDHNPTTGESLGLLVEEARTNLLLNSATLSTQNVTVTAAAHTLSFTGTGTVTLSGTSTAGPLVGTGTGEANRVSLTFTPTAGTLTLTVSGTVSNAQLEPGSFRTSYIPTTTAAATRSADVASITGTAFSSWYRQDEGTVFCGFSRSALISSTGFANLWALSDNTASERYLAYNTGSSQTIDTIITDNGVGQGILITPGAITANSTQAHSFAYKVDDFAATRNAGAVDVDSSGTLPTVNRLYVGAHHAGVGQFSGTIRRLTYWPARLPNSTLQALTQ